MNKCSLKTAEPHGGAANYKSLNMQNKNIQPPILTDKKIDRIIKVVVAVGGIEPPSHSPQELVLNRPFHWDDLLLSALYQLIYTAK